MDINEYNKYKNDKIGLSKKSFHVVDFHRGKSILVPIYTHQKEILELDRNVLIKKGRQEGVSEALAFDIAYNLNFSPDCNMAVILPNISMATHMKEKILRQFSSIPDNIRVKSTTNNKYVFETNINSCVEVRSVENFNGRSQRYDKIYMEEVDVMKDFDSVFTTSNSCLSTKGRMVITSTPTTNRNLFHSLWMNNNKFDKLEIKAKAYKHNSPSGLNALTKKDYDKIIRECIIT